jgi:hypothetical protein
MILDTARRYHQEHFSQEGLKQGLEQGREDGLLRVKREQCAQEPLLLKFGPDDTRSVWLDTLSSRQLDLLAERLLSATDEAALRAEFFLLAP